MSRSMKPKQKSLSPLKLACGCISLPFLALIFLGVLGALLDIDEPQKTAPARTVNSNQSRAISPEDELRRKIIHAVGKDDVEKIEISQAVDGKRVLVMWNIRENLTAGMTRRSAKLDIKYILEAVKGSPMKIDFVFVRGTHDLIDKYGNTSRAVVVKAHFSGETINRINFANFLTDKVYEVAEEPPILHPAFRE